MPPRGDRARLLHMFDHAVEAHELMQGRTRDDLDSDRVLMLALVRLLEIVGEAASRVSAGFRDAHPTPWLQIVGLRNRLIHGYDSVDLDVLWQIAVIDLPPLIVELQSLLATGLDAAEG